MSHNALITICKTATTGYSGRSVADDWYLKTMLLLKYATKNSQSVFQGCVNYNVIKAVTVAASNQEHVIVAKGHGYLAGSAVMIGTQNVDRGNAAAHDVLDYAVIKEGDERFPSSADGIHFLYAYGDMTLLDQEPVTVLGMRGPSDEARSAAVSVLRELMDMGRPVMSTLDTGLDAYSMLYALNERMGQIVVLASPLHQCMPESQKELMLSLANAKPANLLVSPFPPSAKAQKWFTVPRNEVLVALTDFLVILEERDGGPLWKLARSLTDRGGRVMLTDSCLSNPLYSQARLFAEDHEVLVYRRHGDLKRILTSHSSRRRKTEAEQLELF